MRSGRMQRMSDICTSFQGEVNETTERQKGTISDKQSEGPLILRGANVCLYLLRAASQGEPLFLRVSDYSANKAPGSKAFHARERRVGFQRSSPQNNFRRLVACMLERDSHCFDTISYIPESESRLPLEVVLGLLNTNLLDWYFRLGSTNSKVNEYQFNNLPCPMFADHETEEHNHAGEVAIRAIRAGDLEEAFQILRPSLACAPFSLAVRDTIAELVQQAIHAEQCRGEIARSERSALCVEAQPYQDLIDRLLYAMAGLSEEEARGLEERLARML